MHCSIYNKKLNKVITKGDIMNNNNKFTPGPWVKTFDKIFIMANGLRIATVADQYGREANATLIAAAPDLLAAAEDVVARWDTPTWKDAEPTAAVIGKLRAAIAKAKGEQ